MIGITESKLDATVLDGEININSNEVIRSDRNRHGGGVACYIRHDITFNVRRKFSSEMENIFFDILNPKTKPIFVGVLYRIPDQSRFLDRLSSAISNNCKFDNQEVYILRDLNINLLNKKNIFQLGLNIIKSFGIKHYQEFCSLHGLKQLINVPTRIAQCSLSLFDHVLTNSPNRVSQAGVVDVSLSDDQLIYCTRKVTRARFNKHKYIETRSLKNNSKDLYLDELGKVNFPNYSNFSDVNDAYSDFIGEVISVIDKIAPVKEIRVKTIPRTGLMRYCM